MEIDDLTVEKVRKTNGFFTWEVDVTQAADLENFLNSKPDGTIVFVDCQNASDNVGVQVPGAFHIHTESALAARDIFQQLWKNNPKSLGSLLAADMVVFYCSYAHARSPAAMTSYLKLRANLAAQKRPMRQQKVVVLERGLNEWKSITGRKMRPWNLGLKKAAVAKGDDDGEIYTLYTE
ncbi:hypothetical protein PFICI_01713 [Pestalotiopsis fici W106-1]|uniref:Rhodanese domain-containing protein n=1 Tax=Pestalotiopsis fici (strain W106-1 / CGMCC3.15140) TaxID=1229662 RepID=W3XPJ7_PESFW|nr:uncharacterized protein PFICI_01713 [Pestalotiopsis fici W106-1]ETS87885.1 hypothetical protein PFICI_01713 [Pestalotiopsis fici W106-1]